MRVMHAQYGEGTVISSNGSISTVQFDQHGQIDVQSTSLSSMIFG